MVAADPRTLPLLETPDDIGEQLVQQARMLQPKWYYAAMKLLNDCDLQYRTSSSKQLLVELTLIRLSQLNNPDSPFDKSDRKVALRDPSDPYRATLPDATPKPAQPQPAAHTQPPVQTQPAAQPQPVAQPRPATQPRPSVQPQAPVQSAAISARRPRSFQLGGASAQASSSLERLNESFSDEQFMQAWYEYIRCNPHQQILTSAMTSATPRRRTDQEFSVLVDHPAQVQAFESAMPTLLKFLREHLRNDFLTLKAEINPDKKIAKFLPPQEFLRKVVTDNAALGEFLKQLDIEIC